MAADGRDATWLVWQLIDSAFPAGGLAHSAGIEAAWQHGEIYDGASLAGFISAALEQMARAMLPFAAAAARQPGRFAEFDLDCDVVLSNHVANRASRGQGQSFLAATERIFDLPELSELRARVRAAGLPAHLAVVWGALMGVLGFDADAACEMFAYVTLRAMMSAAVRLGIVGPLEGQSIQRQMSALGATLARRAADVAPANAVQTAPILEIMQAAQDRLYSRLFQS